MMEADICLEVMDRVLPVLFLDDDGGPLEFSIRCFSSESKLLSLLIKKGGGVVHWRRDGPHTILLDKPDSRIFGEEEYFSCQYILDCAENNHLADLNNYRLNKYSKYVKDYDANLVLLKIKSWKDIPLENKEDSRNLEKEQINSAIDADIMISTSKSVKTLGRPYREIERIAIINWIIKNKSYSSVGGNSLWMQMEEEKVCEGRSWQSLKEHFKKKILPSIDEYGLSKKHIQCFRKRRAYCI